MSENRALKPGAVIALISIPIFIGAMDLTVVSAVLPQVIYDLEIPLQTGLDEAAWIVTGYLLVYSIAMLFMGRLSDIFGRRKTYLTALIIFALGSFMVAISDGWISTQAARLYYLFGGTSRLDYSHVQLNMIILSRMVQAFGGGAMVPVGMALVGDLYPAGKRARALGVIAAIDTAGWVIGHLYGGILVRFFNWQMIFWLNLPICLISFLLVSLALKDIRQPESNLKMDWLGALLAAAILVPLNIGLGGSSEVELGASSVSDSPVFSLPALLIALVFLLLFIFQQSRARSPLLQLALFKKQNFSAAILANLLIGGALFIAIANVPLFINSFAVADFDQGAWESGWVLSALTIPIALASFPGGWLTEKFGYRLPSLLGILLAVAGFALTSRWEMDTSYAVMVPQLVLTGIGLGLTIAPIATAVVNAAPEQFRGIASALVLTFRLIGMTAGVSAITSFGLQRADVLTVSLINSSMSSYEMFQISLSIMMQVINETFLIAGAICILAILPAILLKTEKNPL